MKASMPRIVKVNVILVSRKLRELRRRKKKVDSAIAFFERLEGHYYREQYETATDACTPKSGNIQRLAQLRAEYDQLQDVIASLKRLEIVISITDG
jgi:hypothetical protein